MLLSMLSRSTENLQNCLNSLQNALGQAQFFRNQYQASFCPMQPTRITPSPFVFLFADHKDIFLVDLCHLILNPVSFAIFISSKLLNFTPL